MIYNKPLILIKGTGGIVDQICNKELEKINDSKNYYFVNSATEAIEKAIKLIEN
jgi:acetylornithine/succinyldiaminopimelate/putrescine aminotransferase